MHYHKKISYCQSDKYFYTHKNIDKQYICITIKITMNDKLSLCLKITNWCNLHCAHCCERSNKNNKPNFMSLDKIEKYMGESLQMNIRPSNLLAISGGEAFAPYMMNEQNYIPFALDLAYSYGYIPTLKTNGTWGDNDTLRIKILSDIASRAYKYGKLITLDISIDEFHNNKSGVVKIINNIVRNPGLSYTIRFCLVGFNTNASKTALDDLKQQLQNTGLNIEQTCGGDWMMDIPGSGDGLYICNDYSTPIYNLGRAKQTKTFTSTNNPNGNDRIDCLQIDNSDNAILNYQYREPIKNRPLKTVLESLMQKAY